MVAVTIRRWAIAIGASILTVSLVSACTSGHSSSKASNSGSFADLGGSSPAGSSGGTGGATAPGGVPRASVSSGRGGSTAAGAEAGTSPAGAAPQCKYATTANVNSAFGAQVINTTSSVSGVGTPICKFVLSKSNAGAGGSIYLAVNTQLGKANFDQVKSQTTDARVVSGLGDEAYYVPSAITLHVLKAGTEVTIQAALAASGGKSIESTTVSSDLSALAKVVLTAL